MSVEISVLSPSFERMVYIRRDEAVIAASMDPDVVGQRLGLEQAASLPALGPVQTATSPEPPKRRRRWRR